MKARQKRLEEELKLIREKHNPVLQTVQKQVSEIAIASGVTKLLLSAFLAFPLHSSRGWGDASECHPAVGSVTATLKDISCCAKSRCLPWTVRLVLWPFG